jgi:predicted nuclease of predicted toxin-antitoxin system
VKWYADESVERRIVDALRAEGHDVVAVSEVAPSLRDEDVLRDGTGRGCVLLTNDTDFGGLVFRGGHKARGVVLLRLRTVDAREKARRLMEVLPKIEDRIVGHFVVVEDAAIRIRPLGMLEG